MVCHDMHSFVTRRVTTWDGKSPLPSVTFRYMGRDVAVTFRYLPLHGTGSHRLQRETELLRDEGPPSEARDVLEVARATRAEARRFDGADLEDAAHLVEDERGERLARHVLGDDQQRLLRGWVWAARCDRV